jgi:hypothetical protein
MSDGNTEALGALMAGEIEKINAEGAAFAAQAGEQRQKMSEVYDAMFSKLSQPKTPPLPPEIQEIVNVLRTQPRLIPYVQKVLQAKVAELNSAIDAILS